MESNLSKLIHTQIEVHLKALMKKTLKDAGLMTDERSIEIDGMDLSVPFDEIDAQLNVSDVVTGDTVLNMTEQMKTAIQQVFRRRTDELERRNVCHSPHRQEMNKQSHCFKRFKHLNKNLRRFHK